MVTSITPKTQRKRASKELYIGKKIAPKVIRTNKIDENGKLIDKRCSSLWKNDPYLEDFGSRFNIEIMRGQQQQIH